MTNPDPIKRNQRNLKAVELDDEPFNWAPAPDATEYSVDKFYVRSTNNFNHSSKLRVNL